MIQVREPTPDLYQAMAVKGREFHAASVYRQIPYCEESMVLLFEQMASQRMILIAEEDGAIVGGIGGLVGPAFFNQSVLLGAERFWWLDPDYRNSSAGLLLIAGMEAAAARAGCAWWMMISLDSSDPERAEKIYTRRGYVPAERGFLRRL